jgi:hypothetical protein
VAEPPSTLVTERMREMRGVPSEPVVSPPIAAADIRRWAIAVYWPETPPRLYWDEEYARTTRWGGIVAPRGFNPFAWPIDRPDALDFWAIDCVLPYPPPPGAPFTGGASINGGQSDRYGARMRPDDVISQSCTLVDWTERETRLGPTLFTTAEHTWTNQHGEHVRTRRNTLIRFTPPAAS